MNIFLRLDANAAGRARGAAAAGRAAAAAASGRARLVANHDPGSAAVGPVVHGLILLLRWFLHWFPWFEYSINFFSLKIFIIGRLRLWYA